MTKHIAVLMGGLSSEREVSLNTGKNCAEALERAGYRVTQVDVGYDIAQQLVALKPDVAFNALHGRFGEDGTIQGLLEFLQIPYTHSGVLASALAMDKFQAKIILEHAGVPVAQGVQVSRFEAAAKHVIKPPYVVKPVDGGSSIGVFIVRTEQDQLPAAVTAEDWPHGDAVLVEKFVAGLELTCAVIMGQASGIIEILQDNKFYDYEAKYAIGGSKHIYPAKLKPNIYHTIQELTLKAHHALGCRGVTRADFRYDPETGELVCLEVNTQPGMTSTSLVPELAGHMGHSFEDLVRWIVEDASCQRSEPLTVMPANAR